MVCDHSHAYSRYFDRINPDPVDHPKPRAQFLNVVTKYLKLSPLTFVASVYGVAESALTVRLGIKSMISFHKVHRRTFIWRALAVDCVLKSAGTGF